MYQVIFFFFFFYFWILKQTFSFLNLYIPILQDTITRVVRLFKNNIHLLLARNWFSVLHIRDRCILQWAFRHCTRIVNIYPRKSLNKKELTFSQMRGNWNAKWIGQIMELYIQYLRLVGLMISFFTFKYLKISSYWKKQNKTLY